MPSEDEAEATTSLHRQLMTWNYIELCSQVERGQGPGGKLSNIPTTFDSVEDYISKFEPLMLEECAALLMRGSQEGEAQPSHEAHIASTQQQNDFLLVCFTVHQGVVGTYGRNDMVFVSRDNPANWEAVRPQLSALGIFDGRAGEQSMNIRLYLPQSAAAAQPTEAERLQRVRMELESQPRGGWFLLRLSNMSTITREWEALHKLRLLPFVQPFLSGHFQPADAKPRMYAPPGLQQALEREYNASQMAAMQSGLDGDRVVLIQGPPGTGKTRTILGLLSIVLHSSPHRIEAVGSAKIGALNAAIGHTAKGADLTRLWLKASPWVAGKPTARENVKPWDAGDASHCFGLTTTHEPVRIGQIEGNRARLLVCAPSNSALDELLLRVLKHGIRNRNGNLCHPLCVRVGLQPHHNVMPVFLDELVQQRMHSHTETTGRQANRGERDVIRAAILDEAQIVFSTLSFAGSSVLTGATSKFDCVIIDEAAQAVEPSTLIPLVNGCEQIYLVGDPIQLPATVISARAEAAGYSISLFKRMQAAQGRVQLLDTQYRMHPAISSFPSAQFYSNQLRDASGMAESTKRPWHDSLCFGPVAFFDVDGEETQSSNRSLENTQEAEMVLSLYDALTCRYPELRQDRGRIGIISPYKAQVMLIKSKLVEALGEEAKQIDIHSIDGFQGREKEIIIFSAVRSRKGARIGFVADERRINVGLTRAQTSLLLVGNAAALSKDPQWSTFIGMAETMKYLYKPSTPKTAWINEAAAGRVGPIIPHSLNEDTFMPQAEPGIDDDMDMMAADEVQGQSHPQRDRGAYGLSQAKKSQGVRGRGHGSNLKRQKKTAQ